MAERVLLEAGYLGRVKENIIINKSGNTLSIPRNGIGKPHVCVKTK